MEGINVKCDVSFVAMFGRFVLQYTEEWICYKCDTVSAKRLTVMPGETVVIKDEAAYGFILLQGSRD